MISFLVFPFRDLAALGWLAAGESVLFGPVGVGKTHVAQALGHLVARRGGEVRFAKTSRVLADLATGRVPARSSIAVQILGRGGVPASGVSAVVVNLTVTAPGSPGNITAYTRRHHPTDPVGPRRDQAVSLRPAALTHDPTIIGGRS